MANSSRLVMMVFGLLFMLTFLWIVVDGKEQMFNPPLGPPCRKSPELAALSIGTGTNEQMLVAFGGKGWDWTLTKKGKGKAKHLEKEVTFFNDMWTFDFGSKTWQELDVAESPAPRWKAGSCSVYDSSRFVIMGGCTETSVRYAKNDLWVFKPSDDRTSGNWTEIETTHRPVARRGHVMIANSSHLIIFGGKARTKNAKQSWKELPDEEDEDYEPGEKCLIDVWSIKKDIIVGDSDESSRRWHQGAPFPAGCRWGGTGSFAESASGETYLAVFGGRHLAGGEEEHTTSAGAYTYYNDLWLYNMAKDEWSLAPTLGPRPPARDHHGAAAVLGRLFIYGGRRSEKREATSVLDDLWSYDFETHAWHEHVPVGDKPDARFMPGVGSVIVEDKSMVAVFAGERLPGSTKRTTLNDLWLFDPDAAAWAEQFSPTCSQKPDLDTEVAEPELSFGHQWLWSFGFLAFAVALGLSYRRLSNLDELDDSSQDYIRIH